MKQGHKMNFTEKQIQQIIIWYNEGKMSTWIGKQFGCSHTPITRCLKDHNVQVRTCKESWTLALKPCDRTFFNQIDTEEKAYWLGFLYADGNVTDNSQPSLQLCLARRDEDHLLRFTKALKSEYAIVYNKRERSTQCRTRIPSKELVDALTRQGCIPRKTFLIKPPTEEQVPSHLVRHFVRGYFDGDGCFYDGIAILLGTSELMNWIKDIVPVEHNTNVTKGKDKNIYRFNLGMKRPERLVKFYNWLYEDATVWLPRKREKMLAFLCSRISSDSTLIIAQ